MLTLRAPRPDEAIALTELCLRSKAVWGHDQHFMEACRDELTITPEKMNSSYVQIAESDGCIVGVAQIALKGEIAELSSLFVEPARLRCGAGRQLFDWAKRTARGAGAAHLVIEADPYAAGFYRRMGAIDAGSVPSGSIPCRMLPLLRLSL
jgi:N-acetylglutamate synthase-like GNAT family acetyltransferase